MVFVLKAFLWSVFSLRSVWKKNWNSYNLLMIVINTFLYNTIIHSSFIYWFISMEKKYYKNGLIHNWQETITFRKYLSFIESFIEYLFVLNTSTSLCADYRTSLLHSFHNDWLSIHNGKYRQLDDLDIQGEVLWLCKDQQHRMKE